MFAEVVAPPVTATDIRPGARFQLREGVALRVGRSARCRLQLDVPMGQDVCLGVVAGSPLLWLDASTPPVPCSLNGQPVGWDSSHPLKDGDHLVFSTGLVLAFRSVPSVSARNAGLEAAVRERPSDGAAVAVYADFLKERGDPLGEWLVDARRHLAAERTRMLGPLSDSERTGAVRVGWNEAGLIRTVVLARNGVTGQPGLFWHLERLASLPVARMVEELLVDYVVGQPAQHLLAPRGVAAWPTAPPADDVITAALERLGPAGFAASLARLSFGVSPHPLELPRARRVLASLAFPRLADTGLVDVARRGFLELVAVPDGVTVFNSSPGHVLTLALDTRIGAGPECQVLLQGHAPPLACRIVRREEGWVVVAEEVAAATGTSRVRHNGRAVSYAVLRADDLVEPVPGLVFAFRVRLPAAGQMG